MERISRVRAVALLLLFCLVLSLFAGKLFSLQIIETKGDTDNTTVYTTVTTVQWTGARVPKGFEEEDS